jgi:hypothetical protein
MPTVNFTETSAKELITIYNDAVKRGVPTLEYEGNPMNTLYTRYLIEYLAMRRIVDVQFLQDHTFKIIPNAKLQA